MNARALITKCHQNIVLLTRWTPAAGRATALDASCGDACPAAERVGRIFVNGEEEAAEELRSLQVSVCEQLAVEPKA